MDPPGAADLSDPEVHAAAPVFVVAAVIAAVGVAFDAVVLAAADAFAVELVDFDAGFVAVVYSVAAVTVAVDAASDVAVPAAVFAFAVVALAGLGASEISAFPAAALSFDAAVVAFGAPALAGDAFAVVAWADPGVAEISAFPAAALVVAGFALDVSESLAGGIPALEFVFSLGLIFFPDLFVPAPGKTPWTCLPGLVAPVRLIWVCPGACEERLQSPAALPSSLPEVRPA